MCILQQTSNFNDMSQQMNLGDFAVIVDKTMMLLQSCAQFDNVFNNKKMTNGLSIWETEYFSKQLHKTKNILLQKINTQKKFIIIAFINESKSLFAKKLEFIPVSINEESGYLIRVSNYNDHGLVFYEIRQRSAKVTNSKLFMDGSSADKLNNMTDYQLTICYLMAYNFSNEKIADIINQLDPNRIKPTTRSAINVQIERIRDVLSMPSKESLIECLLQINILHKLPNTLFSDRLMIF